MDDTDTDTDTDTPTGTGSGLAPEAAEARGAARRPAAKGLGPDSLTWKYFGDWRGMLLGLWAGSLQNMHPGLGAGVEEHSDFFAERWARLLRSLYPINGVVYDGDRAEQTAREIRGYHTTIKGVDSQGRRYHALDPDTFYWAHATFFMSIIVLNEHFGDRLSEDQKRQLYDESIEWYRLYGVSMRPVPPDWESFQAYWDHMCEEVLEDNRATRDVLDLSHLPKPPFLEWLPAPAWSALRIPIASSFTWLTAGLYPPAVRERLGLRWGPADQAALSVVGTAVRLGWSLLPEAVRLHPRARAGWQRARGEIPPDAPLIETPRRNLPPPDARGNPKHYCPYS